jgi:hypothetical protein
VRSDPLILFRVAPAICLPDGLDRSSAKSFRGHVRSGAETAHIGMEGLNEMSNDNQRVQAMTSTATSKSFDGGGSTKEF